MSTAKHSALELDVDCGVRVLVVFLSNQTGKGLALTLLPYSSRRLHFPALSPANAADIV